MTGDTLFVFALLLTTVVLFASDRLRLDVVAILVVLALMLSGVLSPVEALAGFGDPVVLLIAGLFVVSEGLFRTGIAYAIGNWLMRVAGTSELRLLVLLMLVVAGLSAFMSSTGAVAIFIPVALNLAARIGVSPTQLMMPIALASLMGGMLTLIGTPPNLVVNGQLTREGLEPFGFFDFTPIGLLVLLLGIVYMVLVGRRLLPKGSESSNALHDRLSLSDLADTYQITDQMHRLQIKPASPLIGNTVAQALLRTRYGVTVLGVARHTGIIPALSHTELQAGMIIYGVGGQQEIAALAQGEDLQLLALAESQHHLMAQELGLAEVLLTPHSGMIGKTLSEVRFRERHGLTVLGILRMGKPLVGDLIQAPLAFGDSLLMGGGWKQIALLQGAHRDFLVLNLPREMDEVAPARAKAPWALTIMLAMLTVMTFGLIPNVAAVLIAALAMGFAGCVKAKEIYSSVSWQSLVLIAGMLPMATALEKTGGLTLIVDSLVTSLGEYGPLALMAGLFVLTSVFSQFISNTATTVLVAPIAVGAAMGLSVSPYPFLMTVALAASTAFATPVASPVNTLVLGPGGYRFNDFVKVGVPLQVLVMVVTLLAVPLLFPM
ncbi:MAG: SLC13 family permease [Candidatus Competibacteraceae bacterium]|jgi:di/tricarboxylate transporter|nr:SLC13 family permease [Candidatus Competibacteraceae bacterium]